MQTIRIRAILFKDSGLWCGQCLDYDICAQAKTPADLRSELLEVLWAHALFDVEMGREPFRGLPKAPRKFFEMYEASNSPMEGNQELVKPPPQLIHMLPIEPIFRYG